MEIHPLAVGAGMAGHLEVPLNLQGKEPSKQRRSKAEAHQGPMFSWWSVVRMAAEGDG